MYKTVIDGESAANADAQNVCVRQASCKKQRGSRSYAITEFTVVSSVAKSKE